jgi:hypothetical protein
VKMVPDMKLLSGPGILSVETAGVVFPIAAGWSGVGGM